MTQAYIKLGIAALIPCIAAAALYLLDKKTKFGRLNPKIKQVIFGMVFGVIAVLGTEWGIPINGAQMNCRDAAVLTAGLMFGAPAGIIAGIIGGVERFIAVAWGVGSFTRIACTVSTIIAGVYAALLRRFMFENKKPGWLISLAIGVVMEVFHMTMVFLTNMATPEAAMAAVKACSVIMITANSVSVMLASLVIGMLSHNGELRRKSSVRISQTIQKWMLVTVVLAFFVTSYFVFNLQDTVAVKQADEQLELALREIALDIEDASDSNMLKITKSVSKRISENPDTDISALAKEYDLAEISIVNSDGIIEKSTVKEFYGFDMASGSQSAEFLCLLGDKTEFVQDYGPITYDENVMRKYAGVKTDSGFIQVGYDAENFQQDIDSVVTGITKNRHVGKTGFIMIFDEQHTIVSLPERIDLKTLRSEAAAMTEMPEPDKTFRFTVNGEASFCRLSLAEGYYIISVLPEAEALQMRNITLYVNAFMEILVFAVLFALIYFLIKNVVVNRIKSVNRSLAEITNGNLDEVVNVRSNEEFASLSDDINKTVDSLKKSIAEVGEKIAAELSLAKDIQESALPSVFPAFPKREDVDIFASMDPAKEVGGDFYDMYMTGTDTLHLLIADVSGKGIPAAMFMMRAKTELKTLTETDMPIDEVFTNGNRALCEGNEAQMFVTAWQGDIDLSSGVVSFANAGHNPPLVRKKDGSFEFVKMRPGFVLAGMDGVKYKKQELQLKPGDIIYLYTDGVTEATNAATEQYGNERLLRALNSREFENMQQLCDYVKADVDAFVDGAAQFDDITMLAFKYIGYPEIRFDEAKIADIPLVMEFAEAELEKVSCPMRAVTQINVAIDELYSNIVKYGYGDTPGPISVRIIIRDNVVYLRFEDEGIPYNPITKEDPDVTLSAEERGIGGLGIYMVKKTMDDVKYKYENGKNILTIQKRIG